MQLLSPASYESGSYVVRVDVTDETGATAVPISATWSLYDGDGVVVNNRENVAVSGLSSTFYIPISGDDLAVDGIGILATTRILVVNGTYQSAVGAGQLTFSTAGKFRITDLP